MGPEADGGGIWKAYGPSSLGDRDTGDGERRNSYAGDGLRKQCGYGGYWNSTDQ